MKRIALLFLCGGLVASAQEFRLSHAALLKSERCIVSLRAGTIVEVLSRDEWSLTVRFNNNTGLIPARSLAPESLSKPVESSLGSSARKSGAPAADAANKTGEAAANHGQNSAKQVKVILAAN